LVDAEFTILKALGVGIYRTKTLDDEDPMWCPEHNALLVGTTLTPEEAEDVACAMLGMLAWSPETGETPSSPRMPQTRRPDQDALPPA
jgi:hypothetical protein